VYNLTAIREESRMLTHHLLDALSIERFIPEGSTLADIGSGGGLPGIPLAIARPDLDVASIEPNSKKAAFQQQVRIDLGLENFDVQTARAEAVQPDPGRDFMISRAFGDLADFIKVAGHLLAEWPLLAMKGVLSGRGSRPFRPAGSWCARRSCRFRASRARAICCGWRATARRRQAEAPDAAHLCHRQSEGRGGQDHHHRQSRRRAGQPGQRVLLVDLDPQGNATMGSGIDKRTLKNVRLPGAGRLASLADARVSPHAGYDVLPANRDLAGAEVELVELDNRETRA
jgi:16S rRNA (guanine(527)-N(7))-methyltransferase RsmG